MLQWNRVWACGFWVVLCASSARAATGEIQNVVSDPDAPPQQANGESTGFGHSLIRAGGHLVIGSPRSYRHGDRSGALWFWAAGNREAKAIAVPGLRDWSSLGWSLASQEADPALAAGAPGEQVKGVATGAVHLLQAGTGAFHWLQRLEPKVLEANAGFGHAIKWSEGELWASAPFASGGLGFQEGYVARYAQGASGYRFESQMVSPSPQVGARFGEALAVAGQSLIAGAPGQSGGGAVFVMDKDHATGAPFQVLRPAGPVVAHGGFGSCLALSSDGRVLAIGAPWAGAGKVHVFERTAQGSWIMRRSILAPAGSGARGFGSTLTFEGQGLWVAAPGSGGQVFCLANWRSGMQPMEILGGTGEVALGRALLLGETFFALGAPGHGIATFQPAVKASVRLLARPSLQSIELPGDVHVQSVIQGSPWLGKAALGVAGLSPNKRVELRIWDQGPGGGWSPIATGMSDAKGAWNWVGKLPSTDSRAWKLTLHFSNATRESFELRYLDSW